MDKEKEIEAMSKVLCIYKERNCNLCHEYIDGTLTENCNYHHIAQVFQKEGYGNVEQAVREFADWVIDLLYANSAANEAEQYTHIVSTPEELQDEINAKVKELYGEKT